MLHFKHASRLSPKSMRDLRTVCVAPSPPAWLRLRLLLIPPAFFFSCTIFPPEYNANKRTCCPDISVSNFCSPRLISSHARRAPTNFGGGDLQFAQPLGCIQMNAGINWTLGCSLHFSSLCCSSPPHYLKTATRLGDHIF